MLRTPLVIVLTALLPLLCATPARAGSCRGGEVAAMACLINAARDQHGLGALRTVRALEEVAQAKLRAQLACRAFSHTPCGRSVVSFFREAGYLDGGQWLVGENIALAAGAGAAPDDVMRAWLASDDHRANILFGRFTEQGLAVVHVPSFAGQRDVTLWASEFGTRGARGARVHRGHDRADARGRARRAARRGHAPRQRR
jgi:uncharacterized protein YkwD